MSPVSRPFVARIALVAVLVLPPASVAANQGHVAAGATSPMSARSLGTAHGGSSAVSSISVRSVAPSANRLLALWVVHRRASGDVPPQEITDVRGLGLEWHEELHTSHPTNLTRFALFRAATGTEAPLPGSVTVEFDSPSTMTSVILVEVAGADVSEDGAHAITNLVAHEGFDNTTSRTHHLEAFIDPVRNATLAFHMVGRRPEGYQKISVEQGMQRVAMVIGSGLTSAAAFESRQELNPTFTWPLEKSNGGVAFEIRAPGTPAERAVRRRALTQGADTSTVSTTTAPIEPVDGGLLVALVANARARGGPGVPALSSASAGPWSMVETVGFDTAAAPLKRITVLVSESSSAGPAPVQIAFDRPQDRLAWAIVELSGVDLTEGASAAVRQATGRAIDGTDLVDATLGPFAAADDATLAAVAFDASVGAVPEPGYAIALSTATRLPVATGDLRLWGEWRASAEATPSATLSAPADAAIVALEVEAVAE